MIRFVKHNQILINLINSYKLLNFVFKFLIPMGPRLCYANHFKHAKIYHVSLYLE